MSKKYIISKYTDDLIHEAQSLAERSMEKYAKKRGISLTRYFWKSDKKLAKRFINQARNASDLLKKYEYAVILDALEHPDCKKLESLGAKHLIVPACDEIKAKREKRVQEAPKIVEVDVNEKPRPQRGKKTLFSKLKDG